MASLKTILVVDDNAVNRTILSKILSEKYAVIEAPNGADALALLDEHIGEIAAVMLDLIMPVMDGYAVLEVMGSDARYSNVPIIVTTENGNTDNEIKALALGAWDFVSKPYSPKIIGFRLKNAIDRSQLTALKQLKYLSEYDALTGIFNKTKFFEVTREMLNMYPDDSFAFFRFDVDRFQLINSFFGTAEGDSLLKYISDAMARYALTCEKATYGRIESDVFGMCMLFDKNKTDIIMEKSKNLLAKYNPNYDIVPSIGIYVIEDKSTPVEEMYNRATLAAKTCKGNYVDFYAYYNERMSLKLSAEQEITNEMNFALDNGQFQIYIQPKYDIHTNGPCGGEALVRWIHPQKGVVAPNKFIPVFERNGFIAKLDYYVWEQACKCIHNWIVQGIKPYPVSVNVSRVNIYNPKLAQTLLDLVNKYDVAPELLNLELTESAYTDNPTAMKKTMEKLHSFGFVIMMDDFGSGYSSLSVLKDIAIDILKIDMRFLEQTEIPGRGENIIASVIRMAKWLNIPVIAEGAETGDQVDFLRSVGCDYVQGYYFARPMPIGEYEKLCMESLYSITTAADKEYVNYRYDDIFLPGKDMQLLFNNNLKATAIYEFVNDSIELIRVNTAYYALLGHDDMPEGSRGLLGAMDEKTRKELLGAFRACAETHELFEYEYMRSRSNGTPIRIRMELSYLSIVGNRHILKCELADITGAV